MMKHFVNIGFGNIAQTDKIVSIVSPEAAPIKRRVQDAKDTGMAIDATCGRRTRAVLFMDSGQLVLSALLPETIVSRIENIGDVQD
jgi:regulator of extracellular matrix RemA (YlzA/DUF370 family)